MRKHLFGYILLTAGVLSTQASLAANTGEQLLESYRASGAGPFSAEAGGAMWTKSYPGKNGNSARSCATCHTKDLTREGKHQRTGKVIEPLAPRINPERLSDQGKVEKWFKRNCKWTLGRLCTPQEKGDFLLFIQAQ